jgi:hypothetical protein
MQGDESSDEQSISKSEKCLKDATEKLARLENCSSQVQNLAKPCQTVFEKIREAVQIPRLAMSINDVEKKNLIQNIRNLFQSHHNEPEKIITGLKEILDPEKLIPKTVFFDKANAKRRDSLRMSLHALIELTPEITALKAPEAVQAVMGGVNYPAYVSQYKEWQNAVQADLSNQEDRRDKTIKAALVHPAFLYDRLDIAGRRQFADMLKPGEQALLDLLGTNPQSYNIRTLAPMLEAAFKNGFDPLDLARRLEGVKPSGDAPAPAVKVRFNM